MWTSSCCITCIYQQSTKDKLFSLVTYEDSNSPAMKQIKDISGVSKLVETIDNIVQDKWQCQAIDIEYNILFISCSCEITENERKSIMRKHRRKHKYDSMEPVVKKRFIQDIQNRYAKNILDATKKKEFCNKRKQKYQSLDTAGKKRLLNKRKEKYQSLGAEAKKELLNKRKESRIQDKTTENCIKEFKRKIREGPYFICTVCNRILYKKSVIRWDKQQVPLPKHISVFKNHLMANNIYVITITILYLAPLQILYFTFQFKQKHKVRMEQAN